MLFSSVGFSMDVHYCQGGIRDFSFVGKADKCDMMKEAKVKKEEHACCKNKKEIVSHCAQNNSDSEIIKGKCCHNEKFELQSIDDTNTSTSLELTNVDLTFIAVYVLNSIYLFECETEVNNYFNYKPPPIDYDVTILHQVFII